jgi:hypothetical protein
MPQNMQATRAEIYERARLLRLLGDTEGAKHVIDALMFTEDAGALTAVTRLKSNQENQNR